MIFLLPLLAGAALWFVADDADNNNVPDVLEDKDGDGFPDFVGPVQLPDLSDVVPDLGDVGEGLTTGLIVVGVLVAGAIVITSKSRK